MITYLYRFRPLESLLDGYNELLNQQIYFAEPSELNDPMEGLKDIIWQGDEIVWRNLFKHYLTCLERACALLTVGGEGLPIVWNHIPIVCFGDPSPTPQHRAILEEIFSEFLGADSIRLMLGEISKRTFPMRRMELSAYIQFVHTFAIATIYRCYERNSLIPNGPEAQIYEKIKAALASAARVPSAMKALHADHPNQPNGVEAFFAAHMQMTEQVDFINLYNSVIDSNRANRNFVFLTFRDEYVRQIERLMYPDWYAACFMLDARNAALWGSYGCNHTGVCLKFKVRDDGGRPALNLNRAIGLNSNGPIYGVLPHEFYPIKYSQKHVVVDFFRSIATLPIPTLARFWYTSEYGERSPCGDEIMRGDPAWIATHWERFYDSVTIKLDDWKYENEYRLILRGGMLDFTSKVSRKLHYHFDDLAGIIFGIRTPSKEKLLICKILEQKCRAIGRTDFKFYQAYHSTEQQSIDHAEMQFLQFRS